jgi:hypothetical protein
MIFMIHDHDLKNSEYLHKFSARTYSQYNYITYIECNMEYGLGFLDK